MNDDNEFVKSVVFSLKTKKIHYNIIEWKWHDGRCKYFVDGSFLNPLEWFDDIDNEFVTVFEAIKYANFLEMWVK